MTNALILPPLLTRENLDPESAPWMAGDVGREARFYVVALAKRRDRLREFDELAAAGQRQRPAPNGSGLHESKRRIVDEEIEWLTTLLTRAVGRARAEWLAANPPPPDPRQVNRYRVVWLAATELLTFDSDRAARRCWARWCDEFPRVFGPHAIRLDPDDERALERERDAVAKWLTDAGLDLPSSIDDVDAAAL